MGYKNQNFPAAEVVIVNLVGKRTCHTNSKVVG